MTTNLTFHELQHQIAQRIGRAQRRAFGESRPMTPEEAGGAEALGELLRWIHRRLEEDAKRQTAVQTWEAR